MKKLSLLIFVIFFATKASSQDLLIKDINIITMASNTLLKKQSVWIYNGIIKEISTFKKLQKNKKFKIINGTGKFLMPGLADMHVHLPEEEKIEKLLLANIAAGVTRIRIMNSKVSQLELKERLKRSGQLISPIIYYSQLISSTDTYSEAQADSLIRLMKHKNIEFIKLMGLSNEQTFDNLTKAAKKHSVIMCGHYPVYQKDGKPFMLDMEKTIKSGFKSIEHLGGYTRLNNEDEIKKAVQFTKEYNLFNCPTIDWDIMAFGQQYPDEYQKRLTYQMLPKSITKNWESNYSSSIDKAGGKVKMIESRDKYKPNFDLKIKIFKRLHANGCLLLIGGDAGNDFQADGFNIYEEMINWSKVGIDNYTILESATNTPSLFFNQSHEWGTIEVEKKSEMIIISENPLEDIKNIATIETTIVGETVYKNKELMDQL